MVEVVKEKDKSTIQSEILTSNKQNKHTKEPLAGKSITNLQEFI